MTLTDQICSQPSIQIPVSRVSVEVTVEVEPPTVEHVIFIFRTRSRGRSAVWRSLARKENPSCDHVCYVMSYIEAVEASL
jgi:hypothetical protein